MVWTNTFKSFLESVREKKLSEIWVKDNNKELVLIFEDGYQRALHAVGDCCSTSWIEHITIDGEVFGQPIIAVSEKDLPIIKKVGEQLAEFDEHSLIQAYSTVFSTPMGRIELEYRNESNGYYGGELEDMGEFNVQLDNSRWQKVTGDK